jgi:hypothetical protein
MGLQGGVREEGMRRLGKWAGREDAEDKIKANGVGYR